MLYADEDKKCNTLLNMAITKCLFGILYIMDHDAE